MRTDITGFRGETVEITMAGVRVLRDDVIQEDDLTVPEPSGRPDIERPIDLTDTPERDNPGPAPTPEHHPDDIDTPAPDVEPVD
jgi:hypothetical protein